MLHYTTHQSAQSLNTAAHEAPLMLKTNRGFFVVARLYSDICALSFQVVFNLTLLDKDTGLLVCLITILFGNWEIHSLHALVQVGVFTCVHFQSKEKHCNSLFQLQKSLPILVKLQLLKMQNLIATLKPDLSFLNNFGFLYFVTSLII